MAKQSDPPDGGHERRKQQPGEDLRLRIVHAVEEYWLQNERSLTIREICPLVGWKVPSQILQHVNALVDQGRLRHLPGSRGHLARTITWRTPLGDDRRRSPARPL